MTDHVWLCAVRTTGIVTGELHSDIDLRDKAVAIEADTLNNKGLPVSQDMCPKRIWSGDLPFKKIVDLFGTSSMWIVSARVAEIMREFDLGRGALYPVTEGVYQKDNETLVPGGPHFSWIFGNTKTAFLEQNSPKAMARGPAGRTRCRMPTLPVDDDIAVSKAALVGPSVWIDEGIFPAIFLGSELGDALVAAGLKTSMRLLRVRVIE